MRAALQYRAMTSTSLWASIVQACLLLLGAVVGFVSAFRLQQRNVENARRDEQRRDDRVDRAVRLQVLAYLKAEANEVRSAWTTEMMPLSIIGRFHDRLQGRLVEKDVPQAFPDDADVLYDALAACDFAIGIQRLHEEGWDREDAKAPASQAQIEHRTRMIKGIWNAPFLKLKEVFERVGDTATVELFAKAREDRAVWDGR
jgi:hypothetical protein